MVLAGWIQKKGLGLSNEWVRQCCSSRAVTGVTPNPSGSE